MKPQTFEDYLNDRFVAMNPQVLDDDMPDAFETWLSELQIDFIMSFAEMYGAQQFLAGKEQTLK